MDIKLIRDFQQTEAMRQILPKGHAGNDKNPQLEELLQTIQRVEAKLDVLLMQRPYQSKCLCTNLF